MLTKLFKINCMVWLLYLLSSTCYAAVTAPVKVTRWGTTVKREAQAVYGLNAPTPMFLAQITQESGGDDKSTAYDGGMGLGQFMKGTVTQVTHQFPELLPANPYDATWSIRAMVRLDKYNFSKVKQKNECEGFGAALKGYNAGLGYVMQSQTKSTDPTTWFTVTEYITNHQSAKNFEYSRVYPRIILLTHQKMYMTWGHAVCLPYSPPGKNTFS